MALKVRTNGDAARWIAAHTAFAIACVAPATAAAIVLGFGTDLSAQVNLGAALRFGVVMSVCECCVLCAIIGFHDVRLLRQLDRAHDELDRLARTDQLTGMLNRRGFDRVFELARADSTRAISVFACDIDHFKSINDQHGHEFGDMALRHVADVMREIAQGKELALGRQGGEEFAALAFNLPLDAMLDIAERLRATCETRPVHWDGKMAPLTISVGVASGMAGPGALPMLMARADQALYEAKRSGRNRVVAAPETINSRAA